MDDDEMNYFFTFFVQWHSEGSRIAQYKFSAFAFCSLTLLAPCMLYFETDGSKKFLRHNFALAKKC